MLEDMKRLLLSRKVIINIDNILKIYNNFLLCKYVKISTGQLFNLF